MEVSTFFYIFAQMEVIYKGFTVKDDGTVINRFGKKVGFKQKNRINNISININSLWQRDSRYTVP